MFVFVPRNSTLTAYNLLSTIVIVDRQWLGIWNEIQTLLANDMFDGQRDHVLRQLSFSWKFYESRSKVSDQQVYVTFLDKPLAKAAGH